MFSDKLHDILYSTNDDLKEAKEYMQLPENINWFTHYSTRPNFRRKPRKAHWGGGKKSKKHNKKSKKSNKSKKVRKSKKSRMGRFPHKKSRNKRR